MDRAEKPLAGKRIVLTRAAEQAREWTHLLESLGAQVLCLPMVSFAPPDDWSPLDNALRRLADFDWILFTSQNAVRFFAARAAQLKLGSLWPSAAPKIAAVGPATADAAKKEGFASVHFVAKEHSGEGLVRELGDALAERRVLLPRSDRADDRLPKALRKAAADVTEVVAYRTTAPSSADTEIVSKIRTGEVDAIVFSSPSTFHNLSALLGNDELKELAERVPFAAIGPTTASVIRGAGARVEIEAEESSASGLADALVRHFEQRSATARRA